MLQSQLIKTNIVHAYLLLISINKLEIQIPLTLESQIQI